MASADPPGRARSSERLALEQLRKLQTISDAALAHLEVDELLDELLTRVREALGVDTSAVLLLEEETDELVARAAKGLEEEVERGVRIPAGKGFAGRVAAERRPVAIFDVDHADVLNPLLREKGVKSLLGAPLLARGRVLGVIHVGSLTHRRFEPDEVELLELVAERVALALDRALVHTELLRLDALKREFIVTAAHELRTPASIIFGVAATLASRRHELSAQVLDDLLDALYEASSRFARLIEELLDFSRLESGTERIAVETVRMRPLLEEVVASLGPEARRTVGIEVPDALTVESDRTALERILGNLLSNALGYGRPPVTVTATGDGDGARIVVEDRGPGVPAAFAARLFDPFARAEEGRGSGSGLGLAIARSYVQQVGGALTYEQAEPTGARFVLTLPPRSSPPA